MSRTLKFRTDEYSKVHEKQTQIHCSNIGDNRRRESTCKPPNWTHVLVDVHRNGLFWMVNRLDTLDAISTKLLCGRESLLFGFRFRTLGDTGQHVFRHVTYYSRGNMFTPHSLPVNHWTSSEYSNWGVSIWEFVKFVPLSLKSTLLKRVSLMKPELFDRSFKGQETSA